MTGITTAAHTHNGIQISVVMCVCHEELKVGQGVYFMTYDVASILQLHKLVYMTKPLRIGPDPIFEFIA